MTKERKIEILKDLLIQLSDSANILCACEADERCEVIEEYIKALEQPTSDDCVSRKAVVKYIEACDAELGHDLENESVREDILNMPPVTPTHCIAEIKFSKEDLREICNERIEIECTHDTCKDCFYYNIDEDGHGYHCEKYGHTRFPVYADFYCKDFTHKE